MSTELESLVVRLTGDADAYLQSMKESERAAIHFGDTVTSAVGTATQALAALGTGAWVHEALHNWTDQENANLKLAATLQANGRNVEALTKQYNDFASAMQDTTVLADEVVLGFLRQAETFGLSGDAAVAATQSAIALSAAVDGTAQSAGSYIRFAAAMQKGDIELAQHMARMIPQLRGIKDQTEFVAKANQLMAGGLKVAGAEAASTTGAMAQLKNAYGDFLEEIGKVVSQGLKAFIADVRNVVRWMASWDDSTKSLIATMATFTTLFLSIGPTLKLIGFLAGAVFTPMTVAIGAALAATATWVESIGGLGKAWEAVRGAAIAAWDWLEPIRESLASFWGAVKDVAAEAWNGIKDFAQEAWAAISGNTTVTWTGIRDFIVDAIERAEFALRNLDKLAEYTWLDIKVGAGSMADSFLDGIYTIQAAFKGLMNGIVAFFQNISWYELFTGDSEGIARGAAEAAKAFTEGFNGAMAGRNLGDSDFTKQAKQQMDALGEELGQSFDEFRSGKSMNVAGFDFGDGEKAAEKVGGKIGKAVSKGAGKELGKLEAALFGSVEAASRIAAFEDFMSDGLMHKKGKGGAGPIKVEAVGAGSVEGMAKKDKSEDYLREIKDTLKKQKPAVELAPASV